MSNTLSSISGFISRVEKLTGSLSDDRVLIYRGHSDRKYEIKPSLFRNDGWVQNEDKMFKELILENPNDFHDDESALENLVRMQHFSLPTKILDFTENPLVALYFACVGESEKDQNGEVVFLSVPKKEVKYYDSDTVSILSNLSKINTDTKKMDLSKDRKTFNETEEVLQLVHSIREEKSYFDPLIDPKDIDKTICVKVKKNNRRIIAQSGLFLIFGLISDPKKYIPSDWYAIKDNRERIIIDKSSKEKLLKDLSLMNISERTMFPDVEKTAKQIKERYKI